MITKMENKEKKIFVTIDNVNIGNHEREIWIDYTKMFACILVVIGHLLQGLDRANIQWNENLYYYINTFIYIFHMPLFMCLSGYLYGKYTKIKNCNEYVKFIKKKAINLGLPYVVFYVTYVLINMFFSNQVNSQKGIDDILNIATNPIAPFWYLYELFFIFLLIPIIQKILKENHRKILLLLVFAHVLGIFFNTHIYVINQFMIYAIYFYIGVILVNSKKEMKNTKMNILIFVLLALIYCYIKKNNLLNTHLLRIVNFVLAIYGIIVSIEIFKKYYKKFEKIKICNTIAKYTFPIYLMHTTFSAGIRIALLKIGINNFYIHFILGFIIGVFVPMIIAKILAKTKYGNIILYPLKTIDKRREYKTKNENCNDRS